MHFLKSNIQNKSKPILILIIECITIYCRPNFKRYKHYIDFYLDQKCMFQISCQNRFFLFLSFAVDLSFKLVSQSKIWKTSTKINLIFKINLEMIFEPKSLFAKTHFISLCAFSLKPSLSNLKKLKDNLLLTNQTCILFDSVGRLVIWK